ncbi:MAG TPA: hypothetical protein ENH82_13900 [bacterium]|nr:hypothetical protein [bacterium]
MFVEPSQLEILAFHLCLAFLLFLTVNILGRHSRLYGYMQLSLFAKSDEAPAFNFLFRILTPNVFIIISSAILYRYNLDKYTKDIYFVVIYYSVFRISLNLLLGRHYLLNWSVLFIRIGITIGLAYFLYEQIISNRTNLMPDFQTISNELWMIIAIYIYVIGNQFRTSRTETIRRKNNYAIKRYEVFKDKYGEIISKVTSNDKLQTLILTVMIFEDFNTPKFSRFLERILFSLRLSKTIGIMQVETENLISDEESVKIASQKIVDTQKAFLTDPRELDKKFNLRAFDHWSGEEISEHRLAYKILRVYNRCDDFIHEVMELYFFIVKTFYKESTSNLHDLKTK